MNIKTLFAAAALLTATAASAEVQYQHVRNATAKVQYGDSVFLIDPYLVPQGSYAGFEGTVNSSQRNPMIAMQPNVKELLKGVQAVIVTHTHADHWDEAAQKALPKTLPIFVQNADDAKIIRAQGFKDVRVIGNHTEFNKVKLSRIKGGQHGTDQMYALPQLAEMLGDEMGVVLQSDKEKTLYIVGDTVWNASVDDALASFKPEIVVMNTGYAKLQNMDGSIIMGLDDVGKMAQTAPNADIITVHMDAVNHATVSSNDMRRYVKEKGLGKQVAVPKEGEVLKY
ncbi:L-ascorbate metabolism protein UlaG (beta-lactamase superfamily) [Cricetibacter osteomyelitidis]|uniref:L-ascorbate metabolism protein UlaG (Beta-lactamase superfamily) n=1 Tax=Cricetibacter osteomyelitidis TaxID=1521931 RepID=A0A4R2T233_9PAST|nr:MBL fold metallo-hydrolase [Cricetibacter osteomyelitidis]TCP96015.1 L-ascorbate metabolism protein UlaG (beta-lactamase superfamily) [Cricetibacter osteomyelitidis]